MIAFLRGALVAKTMQSALVDVNGMGFEVFMSQSALSKLPSLGSEVTMQTYLQVREDAFALYGFLSVDEKSLFERLIGVSGVGPKVALAALSYYEPGQLVEAVMSQDVSRVSKIPGIGKKTASRIILELKGSLEKDQVGLFDEGATCSAGPEGANPALATAIEALLSMGFTEQEAGLAVKGAPADATEGALLQYALKKLGSRE